MTPKLKTRIWIRVDSQVQGPFKVVDIATQLGHGTLELSIMGSYDGISWLTLKEMAEFSAFKEKLPTRPSLTGDPTRIMRIYEMRRKQGSPTALMSEGIICGLVFTSALFTLALAWFGPSSAENEETLHRSYKTTQSKNREIHQDPPATAPTIIPSVQEQISSIHESESSDIVSIDELENQERNTDQRNFTRYPASSEEEIFYEDPPITVIEE